MKLGEELPRYLLDKRQVSTTVVYTVLFALVFLLLSTPYSEFSWFALGPDKAFSYTLAFAATATLALVLSRVLMYRCRNRSRITWLGYILWIAAEVVVLGLVYTAFTLRGVRLGVILPAGRSAGEVFVSALFYSAVSLYVPIVFSGLLFTLQDRDNTIRLMNYGNVVSDKPAVPHADQRITLFDNSGVLKFSISSENLYFIESDDNYIRVWYMDSAGEMKQYMLRCRLKTVEDSFSDSELVRCHRKYIVNIRKVSILKSERDGYIIDFDIDSVDPIPISKTYEQAVLARFNAR